ncbi:helix-turn-helix transcriptional regulator [Ideonella livida]|uniref:Helix-turn-helix transcriptional regulator n=1 Tax=Ideonella livida TaxID=2707176 RepID=A0A7C9TMQ9_9BURK|nr:LuxR C-terminal-related transcriptional regulator [Ideonella livida]NDY91866.1 helix-turn-helix transcriptional regulator [Ideonella livida]
MSPGSRHASRSPSRTGPPGQPVARADLLPAFSACLLRLHELARHGQPAQWLQVALQEFHGLLPFTSAWWGENSGAVGPQPAHNWQHGSLGLPPSFADEWNALSSVDSFGQGSMARLGQVCRDSGDADDPPAVAAFVRRHGLHHAMAVTLELPVSGLMFFVSLYRPAGQPAFSDDEALLFGLYLQHLRQHWSDVVQDTLRQSLVGDARQMALCQPDGRLLYLGADLARALQQAHPGWRGTQLPAALLARLTGGGSALRLGRQSLAVSACGELLALHLGRPGGPGQDLSPREREAALLYASGVTYKAIARQLGLSPATVRTYLRTVYSSLGVRHKVELAQALGLSHR